MSHRTNHIHNLPLIAKAIQEYKTTHQTQKECAAKYGIPYKVFSYYFLNGFKKNQKVGGGLIPEETPYQKKAKGRVNNYDVILVGGENPAPLPQFQPPPVNHTYMAPVKSFGTANVKQQYIQPKAEVKKQLSTTSSVKRNTHVGGHLAVAKSKLDAATTIGQNGKKHIDIDFIFD